MCQYTMNHPVFLKNLGKLISEITPQGRCVCACSRASPVLTMLDRRWCWYVGRLGTPRHPLLLGNMFNLNPAMVGEARRCFERYTLHPTPGTLNPTPPTLSPKYSNPEPYTPNPKP